MLTREQALCRLGLPAQAGPGEVRRAYRKQALPLKTQLLTAPRVWLKDRYREELRELVLARDAALGNPDRPGWRAPGQGRGWNDPRAPAFLSLSGQPSLATSEGGPSRASYGRIVP